MNTKTKRIVLLAGLIVFTSVVLCRSRRGTTINDLDLGLQALQSGDWVGVSRQIERLRQEPSQMDQVRILRGGLLLRTGNPREAINELMRIKPEGRIGERSLLFLCEAFYEIKQWIDAARAATQVLTLNPNSIDAHRWLGAVFFDLGAIVQAEEHLKEVARLAPRDYLSHRLLGLIHKDFERYREAITDYQEALKRSPPEKIDREIRLELAQAEIRHNQFESALITLDISWPTDSVEPYALKAECLWSLNRKSEAKKLLQKAMADDCSEPKVLMLFARFALDEGRFHDALDPLKTIVKQQPFNHLALYELSLVHRRLDNESEAERFLGLRNASYALTQRLADLSKRAIEEPSNAELRTELADVCGQLGKTELATMWRDVARDLKPIPQ